MIAGLVTSDRAGSWDDCTGASVPARASYRHTDAGRAAVRRLSDARVWDWFFNSEA